MAGSKSNYLEDEILDHMTGNGAWTTPSTWVFALYKAAVDDTLTAATDGVECTGSTYARVKYVSGSTLFTAASGGQSQNKTVIEFTTAAGNWGTVTHFAILDTTSTAAGNVLFWGDLTASQTINSGNTVQFSTGDLVITEA